MIIKNIEAKIRLATWVAMGSFVTSIILSVVFCSYAYRQVADAHKTIYVLDNNIALQASQTDLATNRPAQYRGTIDAFHSLFFSLTPDDKFIEYQMKKAMYLVDQSGVEQYNNLKENGFFNSILSSSSVLTLQTDSISLDMPRHYFRYYGKLKIDRRSSTVIRSLVTEGYLKDIRPSDNNMNGVLITNWKTLENKDLEDVQKITSDRDPRDTVFSELDKEFRPYFGKVRNGVKSIADQYPKFLFCMMVINIVLSIILSLTVLRPEPEKKKKEPVNAVAPVSTGFDRILQAGATLRQTINLKRQIDSLSGLRVLSKADSAALLSDLDSLRHISLNIKPKQNEH